MRNVLAFIAAAVASLTPAFYFDRFAHSLPRFFGTDLGSVILFLMLFGMVAVGPATYWLIMRHAK